VLHTARGQLVNAQGNISTPSVQKDGSQTWRAETKGAGVNQKMQVFSPPAMGVKYLYLTSSLGHLLAIHQKNGRVRFDYA